jgi:hypothetical protein
MQTGKAGNRFADLVRVSIDMSAIDHERSSNTVPATRSHPQSGRLLFKLIYLSAIAIATLGWLWLLVWCAKELTA